MYKSKNNIMPIIITTLMLVFISVLYNDKSLWIMLLILIIHYFILRFAYNCSSNKIKYIKFIRRTIYFIPYLIALLFFLPNYVIDSKIVLDKTYAIALAIIFGIVIFIPNIKVIKLFLDKEFIIFLGPYSFNEAFMELYSNTMSAILQELFYKLFILVILAKFMPNIIALSITSYLFVIEHKIHFASKKLFEFRDYIMQFIMCFVGGVLYIVSGSIIVPIIIHLIYNLPKCICYITRAALFQKEVNK